MDFNVHADSHRGGVAWSISHLSWILKLFPQAFQGTEGSSWKGIENAVSDSISLPWALLDKDWLVPAIQLPPFMLDADQYFSLNSFSPDRLEHNRLG